jgi:transposase-like protein
MPYADKLINKLITKTKPKMTQVTNKLNLNADANEASIVEAINKLQEATNVATAATETANNARIEAEERIASLEAELTQAKAELEASKEATLEAEATASATELVNTFKARIGNKAETLAKWVNLAKLDMEGTKSILEDLPLNVASPKPNAEPEYQQATAASIMANITAKNQVKN